MNKKILLITLTVMMILSLVTNVYAAGNFIDFGSFETAYKLSNEAGIKLPFINMFAKGATYDEVVKHSGISIGQSTIDVNDRLEGVHTILSNDMVSIKGEVEHGIIYGTNIVVEGKISGDTILIANNINILESAVIEKDVVVVADKMKVEGIIKGNLIGVISDLTITGKIENDLRVDTINITLNNGELNGNIYISVPADGTGSVVGIKEVYPNAIIEQKEVQTETTTSSDVVATIVFDGCKTVAVYTIIGWLLTRKDKNIISKAANRFTENTFFGVTLSTVLMLLSILIVILVIILGVLGLGIVAWPALITYISVMLFSISISQFVFGITIHQILKDKMGSFKIPAMIGIFTVLFALTQIPAISLYVNIAINIISFAVILALIFKRSEKEQIEIVAEENDK